MDRFTRTGAIAGTIGGLLLAVSALVYVLDSDPTAFSRTVTTGSFAAAATAGLLGSILVAWGLLAVYVRQADAGGTASLVGAVLALAGMMLLTAYYFTDLFVAPVIAGIAPDILDGTGDIGRIGLGLALVWAVPIVALLVYGIVTLRSRALPIWCGIALIAAGPVNLLPIDGTQLLTAVALSTASYAAVRPQPSPAAAAMPTTA